MVAQPGEVAPTRKVQELKPWLVRHGQNEAAAACLAEARKKLLRVRQMLQHLACEHKIEARARFRPYQNVGLDEAQTGQASPRVGERLRAQIDPDIAVERDAAFNEFLRKETLPAPEIEHRSRRERAYRLGSLVVKPPER